MIDNVINMVIIIIPIILAVSIIFNLIVGRNEKENKKIKNARIQIIVLLVIYGVYGILRNVL